MTMKKSETACVLAFALIFIGPVCDQLNVKGDPTAVENETSSENTIFGPLGINRIRLRGIVDAIISNMTLNTTKKNEEETTFCNHKFKHIDAAMVVAGKIILFVDKNQILDERHKTKYPIEFIFIGAPESIQAAVFYEKNEKTYLFKDDRIMIYRHSSYQIFFPQANIKNSNKLTYNPECAIWYPKFDVMYLVKNGYLYVFSQDSENVVPGKSKELSPVLNLKCDAAISSKGNIYFIVERAVVVKIPEFYGREIYYHGNEFFNNKCNLLPNDDEFI